MELTASQLKDIKKLEVDMLRAFIEVCDRLELTYYVIGGTLLGAVRHEGFIPWDDDIDVGMPRRDYEIFLAKGQALLPRELFLQTYRTDPEFPANFAKIRNSNTTFVERSLKNCRINHGVYIDIFPLDYYPDADQKVFRTKKLMATLRITDAFYGEGMKFKTKILRCVSRLLYPSVKKAVEKRERLFRSVTQGKRIANHCGAWGVKEIMPAEWYAEGTQLMFEGIPVRGPAAYAKWLSQVYGDYMKLPPEEKRVAHHYVEICDLDKPYLYYAERT